MLSRHLIAFSRYSFNSYVATGSILKGDKNTHEIYPVKFLKGEVLRLYPPVAAVDRDCQKDSVIPSSGASAAVHIPEGSVVWLPIYSLHHNEEHWPEPEKFDPERFSDKNNHKIKPFTYMSFGLGPRLCIGQRFALLEVKLVLVHLIANFDLRPSPKTKEPMQFESGFNMIRGGFWTRLTPRKV